MAKLTEEQVTAYINSKYTDRDYKPFLNEYRDRYYGKRIGDIVTEVSNAHRVTGEVIDYGSDNNRLSVLTQEGKTSSVVADLCDIDIRVEDRFDLL